MFTAVEAPNGIVESDWQPTPALASLADDLRLLGDPRRLTLVALLAKQERCVCEFQDLLNWPQNLISHHLGALRRAGFVATRRQAQWIYYSLVPDRLARVGSLLGSLVESQPLPVVTCCPS